MVTPIKFPARHVATSDLPPARIHLDAPLFGKSHNHEIPEEFLQCLPCVLYECNASFELTYLSPNVHELIGLPAQSILGRRALWEERLPPEHLQLLWDKINSLEAKGATSLIHAIVNDRGLTVWICNSFRRLHSSGGEVIRGCMVPLYNDTQIPDLEQGAIGRFIHKLGNHFQLLNLVINSLRKTVSESRETAVLEETVVKAIELTRTFSEYCQTPTRISIINLFDIIDAAAVTHSASFPGKEVTFDQRIDDSLRGVRIHGDPYLLELALGSVLKNAFEATPVGGIVALHALAERCGDHKPIVRISVVDSGSGIETKNVDRVKAPFYTSKKDHDGLGLSMAVRFVQMHGGVLRVKSREGGGTEVEITLPAEPQES